MNKFSVIWKETYRKNVKSVGFLIMVLSPLVIIGILLGIGYFAEKSSEEAQPIAVVSEDPALVQLFSNVETGLEVNASITTKEAAEKALEEEKIDGYLEVKKNEGHVEGHYVHIEEEDTGKLEMIRLLLTTYQTKERGEELGLTPEETRALTEQAVVRESSVSLEDGMVVEEEAGEELDEFLRIGAAYLVSIGIFIFIMTYAAIIAEEIASEKGTRIMEIILSSVSSTTHFFGKLCGVLLVCLTQIVVYAIVGVIAFFQIRKIEMVQELLAMFELRSLLSALFGYSFLFFILGIILYIVMAAFFGSLVTKMEDVNKAVSPVVMMALAGFYGGIFAFASPGNGVVKILSYIPLFTPFIMPFRIAADSVSSAGTLISVAATALFTVFVTWISLMLYRSNVLIYSDATVLQNIKRSWNILKSDRHAKISN